MARYRPLITGVLSVFDRLVFRGSLLPLIRQGGMFFFLERAGVRLLDFKDFVTKTSDRVKKAAYAEAASLDRPIRYLESSGWDKEKIAERMLAERPVDRGLICLLTAVEPSMSFEYHRSARRDGRGLRLRPKKCLHRIPLPFSDEELQALTPRASGNGAMILPSDQIIAGWAKMWREGQFPHPVAIASTVDEDCIARVGDPLQFCGGFTLVLREVRDRPDGATIEKALSSFEPEAFFGPWVSEQDRSPVRRVGTKNIVRIVTNAALTLAEQAALQGERAGFDRWMAYARELENGSELGPVFGDRIRQLDEKGVPP